MIDNILSFRYNDFTVSILDTGAGYLERVSIMSATIDNATGEVTIEQLAIDIYDCDTAVRGGSRLVAVFKGLDFVAFTAKQKELIAQLVLAKLSANTDAASTMFTRVTGNLGIVKPKAAGASAEKQAKRETAKLETAKLVESAGITADNTAEEILQKAVKATGAQQRALTDAAIVKGKADEKADAVAFTAEKNALAKAMKACTDKALIAKGNKLFGLK